MQPFRRSLPALVALALAAGCAGPPTTPPTGGGNPTPRPPRATGTPGSAAPDATPLPPGATPAPPLVGATSTPAPIAASLPPIVSPGVVASLVGRVKAPAGVLSNNGAGLISDRGGAVVSNNGGGVVSNNGGGYRLRQATGALEQFYVKDAVVELVDGAGTPVAGFKTTTDAAGGYAFTQALPDKALVLRVTPPGAAGALTRLVPRATREADVDLASSLVAGYVLGKYVDVQADRQGTLEKLPGGVERETVTKAVSALSGGALAAGGLPVTLTTQAILDSATRLRAADAGFDAQLEVVRKLLIAAGVPNLGTGLPALKLSFPAMTARYVAPDESFYFATKDGTIWRINPDGTAEHLAGRGGYGYFADRGSRGGMKALDLALSNIGVLGADPQRRLLVSERYHGTWRLEPDGSITALQVPKADARGEDQPLDGTFEDDGSLLILEGGAVKRLPPNQAAPVVLAALPGAQGERIVPLSGGRWLVASLKGATVYEPGQAPVVQWSRPEGVPGPLGMIDDGSYRFPSVDQNGNVFYEAGGELRVIKTDGQDVVVAPASAMTLYMQGGLLGPDGAAYLIDGRPFDLISSAIVWKFPTPGAPKQRFLGITEAEDGFLPGGTLPLLGPNDMDVQADGTLWVADNGAVLRIRPGGRPEVVLARDAVVAPANEPLLFTGVKVTAAGLPVVRAIGASRELILRQTAGGGWEMPLAFPEEWANKDSFVTMGFDVAPDGTVYTSHNDLSTDTSKPGRYLVRIHRAKPGAAGEVLVDHDQKLGWILKLAVQPDGSLRLATNEMFPKFIAGTDFWTDEVRPGRWSVSPAGVPTELPQDGLLPEAFDAQGRGYAGDTQGFSYDDVGDHRVRRVADGKVVAGDGAPVLGGRSLDESIGQAEGLAFDGAGNLYIRDPLRRQIRRVAKEAL